MKELELEKVLRLMRNRNYLNKEQLKTVSMAILSLSKQKIEVNLQEKVVILENKVKKLEEQLKEQRFNTLQPPQQIINQYINNANIQMGPPKRMNVNIKQFNNIDLTDPQQEKMIPDFKKLVNTMKKVFKPSDCNLKPSKIVIDANNLEEIKE